MRGAPHSWAAGGCAAAVLPSARDKLTAVSHLETVLVFVGIPVAIYAVVAGLSYLGKPYAGKKPAHYRLGQPWTHGPVLWSATDEVTLPAHLQGHDHPANEQIGGRAHGAW